AGQPLPVYPWTPGKWDWPTEERKAAQLRLPDTPGNRWPISRGAAGMETLLLLARETTWPRDVDLRALLAGLPRPAMQQPESAVWFRNWDVVLDKDEKERGANFFDERRPNDPVMRAQQILRERLQDKYDFSRAVSFANTGR